MKKMKFTIIGCGRIAQRHAEYIKEFAELQAVCDVIPIRAKKLAEKYSCNYHYSLDVLLEKEKEVEIVSICTPNGLHAEHTIKVLRAGKHVLCEKPMATSVRDCELMISEAEKTNKRLFVVMQNRFNPPIIELKKVLEENRLGRIVSVQLNCFWNRDKEYYANSDWKGTKKLDGGTLFTQFSHFIDLLCWLIGDIKDIKAFTRNFNHEGVIEFEDTGVVCLRFENGILGTIHFTINSYKRNLEGSITVFGETGTVKVGGQYLNVMEYQNIKDYKIKNIPRTSSANEYGFYQGSMSNHDKVYQNVVDVFINGGSIVTNCLEGLKTVRIIEKIYEAAKI